MRFPTRIPTILGILLIVLIVGGVAVSFESLARLPINASGSSQPNNVQITNLSDIGFTVTWTTDTPASGALIVAYPRGDETVLDERDTGKLTKFTTHSVVVRNLTASADYSFKILSNGKSYMDNATPYHVRTSPTITTSPGELSPAYGSVVTSDNQPAEGALVFLSLDGSQLLSTVVKPSGAWLIPLNLIRTDNGTAYLPISSERITENILVRADGNQSQAITDTLNDSPVPVMVLGKNYDFRKQQAKTPEPLAQATLTPSTPAVLGDQITQSPQVRTVSLVSPADGVAITSQLPLIQGTGIPGKSVTITIGITQPTSDTTIVGTDGLFRYTPKQSLSPGKQTVTIMTMDSQNKPVAITHTFEVLKSGTQVLGTATPSATLAPTVTPIFTPTPTATLTGQPVPTTATTLPTLMLIIVGLILFTGGIIAFAIP